MSLVEPRPMSIPRCTMPICRIDDTLLLCTDGLNKHVPDDVIADTLHTGHSAREICEELIDKANAGGGSDNITVAVAPFHDTKRVQRQRAQEVTQAVESAQQGEAETRETAPLANKSPALSPSKVVPR